MDEEPDPIMAALERMGEAARQIREHDGPIYEKYRDRGKILRDAYNAAGRPPHVFACASNGPQILAAPFNRTGEIVEATPEQVAAWRAWTFERARLRAELDLAARESPSM